MDAQDFFSDSDDEMFDLATQEAVGTLTVPFCYQTFIDNDFPVIEELHAICHVLNGNGVQAFVDIPREYRIYLIHGVVPCLEWLRTPVRRDLLLIRPEHVRVLGYIDGGYDIRRIPFA